LREYVVQSLLHAAVAAGIIEVLIRQWRLARPAERLAFRLLALALPVVLPPLFHLIWPWRLETVFAETRAVFASTHWAGVQIGGLSAGALVVAGCAALGVSLCLRDLVPLARRPPGDAATVRAPDLVARVERLSARLGLRRPPVVVGLPHDRPVLFARGVRHPGLVVSRGVIARLDDEGLDAVLAHELAHLRHGDLWLGWMVMAVRLAQAFNPVVQVVGRAVVQELERRADDAAAMVTGRPGALADGMARLVAARVATGGAAAAVDDPFAALARQGRLASLEARRRRLTGAWPPPAARWPALRLSATAAAIATLLFFVV